MSNHGKRPAGGNTASLIALLDQPAALIDPNGLVIVCNSAFADCLGVDPDTLPRQNIAAFFDSAEDCDPFRSLGDGLAGNRTLELVAAHGRTREAFTLKPVQSADAQEAYLLQTAPHVDPVDAKLRFFVEQLDHGVWEYDTRADEFTVSSRWRQIRGMSPDEPLQTENEEWLERIFEADRQTLQDAFFGQTRGETESIRVEYRTRHKDGHWIWILCRGSVIEIDDTGRPLKIVGTDTDITDIKRKEDALSQLTSKMQLAIEVSGIGIWEFDPVREKVHWDDRMLDIYGVTDGQNERSDQLWETYLHPDDREEMVAYAAECRRTHADFKRDYRILRPDGGIRYVRSIARTINSPGSFGKVVGVNIDVTEDHRRAEELERARQRLEYDSRHDDLTGLANRRLMDEAAAVLFDRVGPTDRYAAMHIDLDRFKEINDTLGHAAGDAVLRHVAGILRDIAGDNALIGRMGGDEFTLLFQDAPAEADLYRLGQKIIGAFQEPVFYQDHACVFGGSIGIALGQGRPDRIPELFVKADLALYAAKNAGRGCVRIYSEDAQRTHVKLHERLLQDLTDAIGRRELICHFQPQFDAETLDLVGAEALVRFTNRHGAIMAPDRFLPMAERAGLLPLIDDCVLDYVLACQDGWHAAGISYPPISLNLCKERLASELFADQLTEKVKPHHTIRLELLETAFLDPFDEAVATNLCALQQLGIAWELDDFGSGRSSIVAMQRTRPSRVKIDRQLVAPIVEHPNRLLTLKSLIKIARLEGAGVVLEGVETDQHLALVRHIGGSLLQGFALSRPMAIAEFELFLNAPRRMLHSS